MDIEDLIKKAEKLGYDQVPDPKPIQVQKQILEILESKPYRRFRTREIKILLGDFDTKISNISSLLSDLVNQEKCERIRNGVYCAKQQSIYQKSPWEKIKLNLQKIF